MEARLCRATGLSFSREFHARKLRESRVEFHRPRPEEYPRERKLCRLKEHSCSAPWRGQSNRPSPSIYRSIPVDGRHRRYVDAPVRAPDSLILRISESLNEYLNAPHKSRGAYRHLHMSDKPLAAVM